MRFLIQIFNFISFRNLISIFFFVFSFCLLCLLLLLLILRSKDKKNIFNVKQKSLFLIYDAVNIVFHLLVVSILCHYFLVTKPKKKTSIAYFVIAVRLIRNFNFINKIFFHLMQLNMCTKKIHLIKTSSLLLKCKSTYSCKQITKLSL